MRHALVLSTVLTLLACGGGGTGPTTNRNAGTMTATVDGTPWSAPGTMVQAGYATNTLAIGGTVSGAPNIQITITVAGVTAPGTFDLGPANAAALALLTYSSGTSTVSTWTTALSPATGSITITAISASGAQGTFQFTGQASPGTAATGQKAVTSGTFSVTF